MKFLLSSLSAEIFLLISSFISIGGLVIFVHTDILKGTYTDRLGTDTWEFFLGC